MIARQVDLDSPLERSPVHRLAPVGAEMIAARLEQRLRRRPQLVRKPFDLELTPVLGLLDDVRLEVRVRADDVVVEGDTRHGASLYIRSRDALWRCPDGAASRRAGRQPRGVPRPARGRRRRRLRAARPARVRDERLHVRERGRGGPASPRRSPVRARRRSRMHVPVMASIAWRASSSGTATACGTPPC